MGIGAGGTAKFGVELENIRGTVVQHLIIIFCSDGTFFKFAVDLSQEEG